MNPKAETMRRTLFTSRIHRAALTGTDLEFEGSVRHLDAGHRPLEPRRTGRAAG